MHSLWCNRRFAQAFHIRTTLTPLFLLARPFLKACADTHETCDPCPALGLTYMRHAWQAARFCDGAVDFRVLAGELYPFGIVHMVKFVTASSSASTAANFSEFSGTRAQPRGSYARRSKNTITIPT